MTIDELEPDTLYDMRIGRAERDGVDWSPWGPGTLYVQRNKKNKVVVVCPKLPSYLPDPSWAEYSPEHHYQGDGLFEAEGYYLQIKTLK